MKFLQLLLFFLLAYSCSNDGPDDSDTINTTDTEISNNNILLIIADDMGKDATQGFQEGNIKPSTPNIDKIKSTGVSFNNLWVNPTCSPTRASIITGKYGYRTGVKWASDELSQTEKTIQKYIEEETDNAYATALIGKWHLSGDNTTAKPQSFGIDYFAGILRGGIQNYYQWQLTQGDTQSRQTEYTSKVFTDLSKDWINSQSQPWFLWLAYNAPHTPFHVPPVEMHSQGDLPTYADGADPIPYYMAAIEAMDYQIGELVNGIPEDELEKTTIIFIGDNGTPGQVAQLPYSSRTVKGSLYQGGINVPMYVSGAGVNRTGEDNNLIVNTDLYCTIAELVGINATEINDSKSFKTLLTMDTNHRDFQYTEMNSGTEDLWAISNGQYKLIVNADGDDEMYHLTNDPYEEVNLLSTPLSTLEEDNKKALETELSNIRK